MFPWLSSILSRLLIDRRGGHRRAVLAKYHELKRVAELSPHEVRRYQDERLADLLNHAREHVPLWREKIRGAVTAENARELLKTLPLMERAAIQENRGRFEAEEGVQCSASARLTADKSVFSVRGREQGDNIQHPTSNTQHSDKNALNHPPRTPNTEHNRTEIRHLTPEIPTFLDATGGSSGTPMTFLVDHATQIAREASLFWANSLAGWNYGDRVAMLWGSDRDVGNARKDPKLELRWKIDNIRWYNAFNMGGAQMAEFHREMSRFKPHLIVAYAGSLEIYARFLKEKGVRVSGYGVRGGKEIDKVQHSTFNIQHPNQKIAEPGETSSSSLRYPSFTSVKSKSLYPLKSIVSSAEVLSPQARKLIESVFGRPVFNRYGNREFGAIAAEDGNGGLRVNDADFVVEIDSKDPVNVPGPVVVTYLNNFAMPFIRYNTGDLAVWVKGEEGRRIARIQGRQGDTIRTKGGRLIHGEYFTHLMYDAPWVKEFQFVQERIDFYRLLVVSDRRDAGVEAEWKRKILVALGEDAEIVVEYVEVIPVLKSGKRKFTVSLV